MLSPVILFSLVAAFAGAAPVRMPTVKSEGLASRFYDNGHLFSPQPVHTDGTPCWRGGRYGYLKDRTCSLVDVNLDVLGLAKSKGHPGFTDGIPCWNDDTFGHIVGASCIAAAVGIELKRDFQSFPYGQPVYLDGTPCWYKGRFGLLKDSTCSSNNGGLDLTLGLLKRHSHASSTPTFVDGTPCWSDNQFGYIHDTLCSVLDLNLYTTATKKRSIHPGSSGGAQNGRATFKDGTPCWQNGRFGQFQNALCVLTDLHLGLTDVVKKSYYNGKPVFDDGTPCWRNGKFGYLKQRKCALLNIDSGLLGLGDLGDVADLGDLGNLENLGNLGNLGGLGLKRDILPALGLMDGTPCWYDDRFGHIYHGSCDLLDLLETDLGLDLEVDDHLNKRLLEGTGLGGLIGESDYRFANAHPSNTPPPKDGLGLGLLGLKKRGGPLGHLPGDKLLESPSLNKLVGHTFPKRSDDLVSPLLGDLGLGAGYFDDDDVLAHLDSITHVGSEHNGYGHGIVPALGLKRSLRQLGELGGLDGAKGLVEGLGSNRGRGTPHGVQNDLPGLTGILGQ